MSERFTTPDPDADDLPEEELPPSRSQRKRDSHAIQEAARRLLALSAAELAPLELSPATLAAVAETARIKDRKAMPRHVKRVANLQTAVRTKLDLTNAVELLHYARQHGLIED